MAAGSGLAHVPAYGRGSRPRRRKRPRDWNVPDEPVELDEALGRFPAVRQSILSEFDDCHLSVLFSTRYAQGWSTVPQASGQLFHRFAAKCLMTMRAQDSEHIPVSVALGILEEVLEQDDVEPRDIVALPLREIPLLEMAAKKFAKDNAFTIRNIMAVERRLWADLRYQAPDGTWVTRKLTGQIDALIAQPDRDGAVVLDWKRTWKLPPERHEDSETPGLSYHGYFQQLFYAWLVMMNYSAIKEVTLREFYVFRTKARKARVTRGDLPQIEKRLGRLVRQFDKSVMAGAPKTLDMETVEQHGHWKPSPGAHCFFCAAPHLCPIEDDAMLQPAIRTQKDAEKLAGQRQVAKAILKRSKEVLEEYADAKGPIPLKDAKGRRVLGHRTLSNGKTRFEEFTPEDADRPPTRTAQTPGLEDAMRKAAARARAER